MFPRLRSIFGTPKPAIKPSARKASSLFSTDISIEDLMNLDWTDVLSRSIQIKPGAFKRVDMKGAPTTKLTVSHAAPNGTQFAMDDASLGNILSTTPIFPQWEQVPPAQAAWYASHGFIGYQLCAIIAQHWLVDKICTMPADDAMRNGYKLVTEGDEKIDTKVFAAIKKADKAHNIKEQCVDFVKFMRVYGIRIALPIIENNDPSYYLLPFDINKVKPGSYRGIAQIDPYWITPELDFDAAANPASPAFYEPTWWRVNGQRIHKSHLVIVRTGKVGDILKPTYYYGGVSVPQKIMERVYAAERTANEGPQLALTKRTTWLKLDVTKALANLQEFLQKMNFWAQTRDNFGLKIVGNDDELGQMDTSLTDFDNMTFAQYTIACAAGDCPAAKVMAQSPKGGLGSEGGYDKQSYSQTLESLQEHKMQPLLERHHMLVIASEIRPAHAVPEGWVPTVEWNEVDTPTAKEQAEINKLESETGNNLVNSGAIDGVDERKRVMENPKSGYNGLGDREPEIEEIEAENVTGNVKSDKQGGTGGGE